MATVKQFVRVTHMGQVYYIPEMWLAGMCRSHSVQDAVTHWICQTEMEKAWTAQQARQVDARHR